jgi:Na+:H+ antiporter, NhaA family
MKKRIQTVRTLYHAFIGNEQSAGIVLILCTICSLFVANTAAGHGYVHFWHSDLAGKSVEFWINDGLMTIFFLLVGLEIKQEIHIGELSNRKKSMLPVIAALGGMVVPASIHFCLNRGLPTQPGIGIPMATDIAFSLGVLSLLGKRVPISLKVFLMALAIIDDLGAIVVIAVFYSKGFSIAHFGIAIGIFLLMLFLNRQKINKLYPYLILGGVMWYFMSLSGIHATISGVLLAFAIPFLKGTKNSPSVKLMHWLHVPVSFVILPIFALANTGIVIENDWMQQLASANSLGITAGLIIGKPAGIIGFSLLGKITGICQLPTGGSLLNFIGIGMLAGIGFTMSIFISLLAFEDPDVVTGSKIAVLIASGASALLGYVVLRIGLRSRQVLKAEHKGN